MYTKFERLAAGGALIMALFGQLNSSVFKLDLFAISHQKLAIIMYFPLAVVVFLVLFNKSTK